MKREGWLFALLGICILEASEFSLGAGVGYQTSPYKDDDSTVLAMPWVNYQGESLYLNGLEAGYKIHQESPLSLTLLVKGRMDGFKRQESGYLEGMNTRKYSLDGGVKGALQTPFGTFEATLSHDLLGVHNGYATELEYRYDYHQDGWGLTPFVGIEYLSKDLSDYYYGVRSSEARAGRDAYTPSGSTNTYLGLSGYYRLGGSWTLFGGGKWLRYGSEIKDSPLIEDSSRLTGVVGINYRF